MSPLAPLLWLLCAAPALAQPADSEPVADEPPVEELPPLLQEPELIDFVQAPYPTEAEAAGVEGTVLLLIEIDEAGLVTMVEVLEGGPTMTPGTKWKEVRKFIGREMETVLEVTAVEPDRSSTLRAPRESRSAQADIRAPRDPRAESSRDPEPWRSSDKPRRRSRTRPRRSPTAVRASAPRSREAAAPATRRGA